jgi:ribosomal-protein-alanine N-acetyltransferase
MIKINETICLRPWKNGDEINLQKVANDYEVAKTLRDIFPYPYTMQDAIDWISYNEKLENKQFLAICIAEIAIGGISLIQQGVNQKHVFELGYWLGREFWGKHIVSDSVIGYLDYFLHQQNNKPTRIFATTATSNIASCKVLERAGLYKEGIMKNNIVYRDGQICDTVLYANTYFMPTQKQ